MTLRILQDVGFNFQVLSRFNVNYSCSIRYDWKNVYAWKTGLPCCQLYTLSCSSLGKKAYLSHLNRALSVRLHSILVLDSWIVHQFCHFWIRSDLNASPVFLYDNKFVFHCFYLSILFIEHIHSFLKCAFHYTAHLKYLTDRCIVLLPALICQYQLPKSWKCLRSHLSHVLKTWILVRHFRNQCKFWCLQEVTRAPWMLPKILAILRYTLWPIYKSFFFFFLYILWIVPLSL